MMKQYSLILMAFAAIANCHQPNRQAASPISTHLEQGATGPSPRGVSDTHSETASSEPIDPTAIAWVNDQAISAKRFDKLLAESRGLFILEQLVAIELVKQRATREGIHVTSKDIQNAYDHSLIEMARPISNEADTETLLAIGKQMLHEFTREKNISLEEYMMSVERNCYLQKMAEKNIQVTDADVEKEFKRQYGRKAEVRHVALPMLSTVQEIHQRLGRGENFGELARTYSTNHTSAAAGGLLPAFTREDEQVPQLMRETVFDLKPGQVSSAVKIDDVFHVFLLEKFIEPVRTAMTVDLAKALRIQLEDKKVRQAMQRLERQLFKEADIRIMDETLRRQFQDRYQDAKIRRR